MKRRLRESVRHHLAVLEGPVDVVINPKKSLLSAEFSQLMREIERAFNQIRRGDVKAVDFNRKSAARTRRP
jgi:ribonuclease P protein component